MAPKYSPNNTYPIPARSGVAVPLSRGQTIKVINTHGTQVIDFFAFASSSPSDVEKLDFAHLLSMSHARASTCRVSPVVGDVLTTNHREGMFEVMEDTTSGVHDTFIAACDIYRYRELEAQKRGVKTAEVEEAYYHDSCSDNLVKGLINDLGMDAEDLPLGFVTPQPLNLFMNIPVHPKGEGAKVRVQDSPSAGAELSFERPVCEEGQFVRLKAMMGCVVVMSACPQDMLEINCGKPVECEFVVEG
jgi:uncharacterized protein